MKFDWVTRFHDINSTVKSVLSSEILKISYFLPALLRQNTVLPFFRKIDFFLGFTIFIFIIFIFKILIFYFKILTS